MGENKTQGNKTSRIKGNNSKRCQRVNYLETTLKFHSLQF
jgi:hypothetical protein